MAHQKSKIEKDTSERWMLTYADLMNLLLIFFIILYAISNVDRAKFDQLANSLKAALGTSANISMFPPGGGSGPSLINIGNPSSSPVVVTKIEQQQMEEVERRVSDLIKKEKLGGKVDVKMEERGIVISITAQLLFKPARADIEPGSKPTIQSIGNILRKIPGNQIRVEGHTDSDPISNRYFASNWQLSAVRAANVVQLLIEKANINENLISSAGYGDKRPVAPNNSVTNKAKNRRVNIVILKSVFDKAEPH